MALNYHLPQIPGGEKSAQQLVQSVRPPMSYKGAAVMPVLGIRLILGVEVCRYGLRVGTSGQRFSRASS